MDIAAPTRALGYLNVTIHNTKIHPHQLRRPARCELIVSNIDDVSAQSREALDDEVLNIRRTSTTKKIGGSVSWQESFEVRCFLGWELTIYLIIASDDSFSSNSMVLESEPLVITGGTTKSIISLKELGIASNSERTVICRTEVTLEFFPNHHALFNLSIDSGSSSKLPAYLLQEMKRILQKDAESVPLAKRVFLVEAVELLERHIDLKDMAATLSQHQTTRRPSKVGSMLTQSALLNNDDVTRGANSVDVEQTLMLSTPHTGSGSTPYRRPSLSSSTRASIATYSTVVATAADIPHSQHTPAIPVFKAATIARSYLTTLIHSLPESPPLSVGLLEKLLSIYCSTLSKGSTTVSGDWESEKLSWDRVSHFTLVAGVWLLQQV